MYHLIYLLFGKSNDSLKSELFYSLLSFNKTAGNWSKRHIQVLVFTEENIVFPEGLGDLRISFHYLKEEDVREWTEKSNGHALILKVRVMHEFFKAYGQYGILVDTDTFFVKDPAPMFRLVQEGCLMMHLKEYPITQRPAIHSFFLRKIFRQLDGSSYVVDPAFSMWNSGVVGISRSYAEMLPEIIFLAEQISSAKEWPADEKRFIEQTAYSYYLQKHPGKLLAADQYLIHYWFFKEGRYLIGHYFKCFFGGDSLQFDRMTLDLDIPVESLAGISYENLPGMMIQLMKRYSLLRDFHFECLPTDTHIGKVLRSHN